LDLLQFLCPILQIGHDRDHGRLLDRIGWSYMDRLKHGLWTKSNLKFRHAILKSTNVLCLDFPDDGFTISHRSRGKNKLIPNPLPDEADRPRVRQRNFLKIPDGLICVFQNEPAELAAPYFLAGHGGTGTYNVQIR
jgi:hypothetical protein